MKKGRIFCGIALILVAVILILDVFHVFDPLSALVGRISAWALLGGALLIAFIVHSLMKGRVSHVFIPLALLAILFEGNLSMLVGAVTPDIFDDWTLILIAVLFTAGFHILLSPFRRKHTETSVTPRRNHAGGTLGHSAIYIDSETLHPDYVENTLGSCEIYFENVTAFHGGASLYLDNKLGSLTLHVPRTWLVHNDIENTLGGITLPEKQDENAPILTLCGRNQLGSITVVYE